LTRLAAILTGLVIAVGFALAAPSISLARGPVSGRPVTGRLARTGAWVTDPQGRVVVMHGFNVVKKLAPFYPSRFTVRDARLLADEGFTVARIGFIWQGLEPSPGRYDDSYVARIARLDSLLGRYGIRTLIDFHQDGWSNGFGFDGAPAWADNPGGVLDSFAAFWRNAAAADGVGIQTRFLAAWKHVAHALRKHTNILGFDPFNEPYPGSAYTSQCGSFNAFSPCPAFERGGLASFYRRVTAAIRAGGAHQIIWPEGVAQNGQAAPGLPRFRDGQTAFNFHYYCSQTQLVAGAVPIGQPSPPTQQCAPQERRGIGTFLAYARRIGVPAMLSEFSCNDVDPDNAQVVDLVDRSFVSWTAWAYYGSAPDPANCPNQGLLIDEGKPGSEANAKQDKLDAFVVPYPQAIAGTPLAYRYHRATAMMTLSYRPRAVPGAKLAAGALTQIFIPSRQYPGGYKVSVRGARAVSGPSSPWLELAANRGASKVTVTVTRRTGGRTIRPLHTGVLPLS
jgi:endoglycosylceramidase